MSTILVVDDLPAIRVPIATALREYAVDGYLLKTHFSLKQLLARVANDLSTARRAGPAAA